MLVLGAPPRQVFSTVAVTATVPPALVLGVPLGVAFARVLWWEVAASAGVAGIRPCPSRCSWRSGR
jgi:putative ABC transport system permease protein